MDKIETSTFKRLIGIWKTEGTIVTGNERSILTGTDSYEFILEGNYILHKADVHMGNEKSQTFELIALADFSEKANMHYYNSKGENGVMVAFLTANIFKIKGDKIKFEGVLNNENTELAGKWFVQKEDGSWTDFIDLKLIRQK